MSKCAFVGQRAVDVPRPVSHFGEGFVVQRRAIAVILVALCAVLSGCWSRGPSVQFVEGLVEFEGQPVADATVFFTPEGGDAANPSGLPATGRTGPDGVFRLNGFRGARAGAGTTVGTYVVTVTKLESDPIPEPDASGMLPQAPPNQKVYNLLPAAYAEPKTSPLRADVKNGRNQYRFKLTGKPGGEVK